MTAIVIYYASCFVLSPPGLFPLSFFHSLVLLVPSILLDGLGFFVMVKFWCKIRVSRRSYFTMLKGWKSFRFLFVG